MNEIKLSGKNGSSEVVKSRNVVLKIGNGSGIPNNEWSLVEELSGVNVEVKSNKVEVKESVFNDNMTSDLILSHLT